MSVADTQQLGQQLNLLTVEQVWRRIPTDSEEDESTQQEKASREFAKLNENIARVLLTCPEKTDTAWSHKHQTRTNCSRILVCWWTQT
jgi:hypothetical protein